ncbi:hypothetical protein [Gracilibacillus sp. Marseille-QA3620]
MDLIRKNRQLVRFDLWRDDGPLFLLGISLISWFMGEIGVVWAKLLLSLSKNSNV